MVRIPYTADSRDGRLMRLLLGELHALPTHLPNPTDARLKRICAHIDRHPDDASTLDDWSQRLDVNTKTLQRLLTRNTGMSFGRWRQQARLLRALQQLAQGEKVIDVALTLVYYSPGCLRRCSSGVWADAEWVFSVRTGRQLISAPDNEPFPV